MRSTVNAPWLSLRVAGKWLPYIVDLQAEHVNADVITEDRSASRGSEPKATTARREG
jgi:hypothetical protein